MKIIFRLYYALLLLFPLNCLSFNPMGPYISIEGIYITSGKSYSPIVSTIVDSNSGKADGDYTEFVAENRNKLRNFDGSGASAAFGYSMGGGFAISMIADYHYRTDFTGNKEHWSSDLRIENESMSAMVGISYEHSIGKSFIPYVLVGAGVSSRSIDGSYGAIGNDLSNDNFNARTIAYFDEIEETHFAYKAQAGIMLMFNEQAGISIGYQVYGTKDLNVLRDNVSALSVDLPTQDGTSNSPITSNDVVFPLTSMERFYIKNIEYTNHSLNFAVRMYL